MFEWWERYDLIKNPFTLRTRFTTSVHFNKLLVETEIFKKYDRLLENPEKLLNQVILVYGEFGSGKTVLFDYIKFSLFVYQNILQKTIFLNSTYQTVLDLKYDFLENLYYELTDDFKSAPSELSVIKVLSDLKDKSQFEGFVLVLDELHKNPNHEVTLDFLKLLQGFYQQVQEFLEFTIIVVGRDEWVDRLKNNPEYSGTISNYDRMPDLDFKEALEIVNKRLKHYSKSKPASALNAKRITSEAMEKLLQNITLRTPRKIMIEVNEIFENLSPDIEIVTPYEISHQVSNLTLSLIKRKIKSRQYTKLNRNLLDIQKTFSSTEFSSAIRILSELYHRTTLDEKEWDSLSSELNLKNGMFLEIRSKLLVKDMIQNLKHSEMKKQRHGADYFTVSFYKLREDLQNYFNDIKNSYGLFPEDYLERIYTDESITTKGREIGTTERMRNQTLVNLENIKQEFKNLGSFKRAIKHASRAYTNHERICTYIETYRSTIKPNEVFELMRSVIFELLTAMEIYRKQSDDAKINEKTLFENAQYELSNEYSEWYPKTVSIKIEGSEISKEVVDNLLELYMTSIHEISFNFIRDLKQDIIYSIYPYELQREERVAFYIIRDKIAKNELIKVTNRLRILCEKFLRKFIKEELERLTDSNWENLLPNNILNRCKSIKAKELEGSLLEVEEDNILDYSNLLDLGKIIDSHWGKLSEFFMSHAGGRKKKERDEVEKDKFLEELEELNQLRRKEAHSRDIGPDFRNRVAQSARDSLKRISQISFERNKRYYGLDFTFSPREIEVVKKSPETNFVKLSSISGFVPNDLWKEFIKNSDVKRILSKSIPVSITDLKSINLKKRKEWKQIFLCFAILIDSGKYKCLLRNKSFVFQEIK